MSTAPATLEPTTEPRWRPWLCFLFLLVAIQVCLGPKIQLSQWGVSAEQNAGVAEGVAWLNGRLDLTRAGRDIEHDRPHDTAAFNGKVYNVFPPLVPALTAVLAPIHRLLAAPPDAWLQWTFVLFVFWPLPILGYLVFRRETGDSAWGALLTLAWMGGTAVLPDLDYARQGFLGPINHVLSQTGLLLLAADLLGKQRIWPALIGLLIAAWSRQMTALYAIPILVVAYQRRLLPLCIAGLALIAAPLISLNLLKFGNPFDSGYAFIYAGRTDQLAERAHQHGIFSTAFILENLWYMHAALPTFGPGFTQIRIAPSGNGTSIWFTTPLLIYIFIDVPRWWRDSRRRLLMLSTVPVMAGLALYHTTGFMQVGYNRFALDCIPIWLVVVAPFTRGGWRTWFTLGATAWSLLYFQQIVRPA